jgi:hypothetical protein
MPFANRQPLVHRMPLFRSGVTVYLNNTEAVVSHVVLRRGQLLVQLKEHPAPVDADRLMLAPTAVSLQRQPDAPLTLH